jgi:hypothetical protein
MTRQETQLEKAAVAPEEPQMSKSEYEEFQREESQRRLRDQLSWAKTLADWIRACPDERVRGALELWRGETWETQLKNPHDTDLMRWLKKLPEYPTEEADNWVDALAED